MRFDWLAWIWSLQVDIFICVNFIMKGFVYSKVTILSLITHPLCHFNPQKSRYFESNLRASIIFHRQQSLLKQRWSYSFISYHTRNIGTDIEWFSTCVATGPHSTLSAHSSVNQVAFIEPLRISQRFSARFRSGLWSGLFSILGFKETALLWHVLMSCITIESWLLKNA